MSEQQVNASSSLAQAPVVALALLAFSASAVVTVTPPERPARPPAPVAAPDALPIAPHPSRGGWRTPLAVPRAAPDARHGQWLQVTAYCATGNRTASGVWPQVGMAAGNRWPFGTRLHIAGVGRVVITDRIGYGSDVDLFMGAGAACQTRALRFGRRHLLVEVVTP